MSAAPVGRATGTTWLVLAVLGAASALACDGLFVDPSPATQHGASLSLSFALSPESPAPVGGPGEAFDLVDEVRVRIVNANDGAVLTEGPMAFTRSAGAAQLEPVDVPLQGEDIVLLVDIELFWQDLVIFVGSGQATLSPGQSEDLELTVDPVAHRIEIQPIPIFDALGQTLQLSASVALATGDQISGLGVIWSSTNTAVVTVTQGGLLRSVGAGQAQVTATHQSVSATADVMVVVAVARVDIEPDEWTIALGSTFAFSATAFDGDGTALARAMSWSSSDPSRAVVDQSGLVTGVGVGTAQITAATGGQSATARVTVTADPPGVLTGPASDIQTDAATLNGTVDAKGLPTEAWFEWSTSPTLTGAGTTPRQTVGPDQSEAPVSARVEDLAAGTRYYFRLLGENQVGRTAGDVFTLTTATPITIVSTSLPDGLTGRFYSALLTADGGDGSYTWSAPGGGLPPGLTLSPSGLITGVPTLIGLWPFSARVESDGQVATADLSIQISATGKIRGVVVLSEEIPLQGVPVTLSGPVVGSTTTDANGGYVFNGLPDGTYTVSIIPPPGTTFGSTSQLATVADGGSTTVDFFGN